MKQFLLLIAVILSISATAQTLDWTSPHNGVYSYSSARAVDLTNDGVKDIVLGAGRENQDTEAGIVAVDGTNGVTKWRVPTRNQIYASPVFQDITSDGIPEVFIGGREAEFYAVDGANGNVIWEFFPEADTVNPVDSGWYNFYSPQWIPDQDNDGYMDLLLANGGDYNATVLTEDRPQGNIMVVSSEDGKVLAKAGVPDGKETYMSPLVTDLYNNGNLYIIFGTGGENGFNSGHIYKAPLTDLMNNDLSNAEIVVTSPEKGFIAPPSLADLNDDSVLDIIVNAYNGKVVAVDGLTNETIWEVTIEGGETNASPGIGHFNDDNVPDVFSTYAIGLAPTFTDFRQVMIDGATGEIQFDESIGFFQFNSPCVADLDQDGFDEVIMTTNNVDVQTFDATHEVRIFDFNDNTQDVIYGPIQGANVNSTAYLGNLDNDGQLDFVYLHSQEASIGNTEAGFFLKKLSLATPDDITIPWGGYIGTNGNGVYENLKEPCAESTFDYNIESSVGGCGGLVTADMITNMCDGTNCTYEWLNANLETIANQAEATGLTSGAYYVRVTNEVGCTYVQQLLVEQNAVGGLETSISTTNASDCVAADGSVFIQFLTGTPPYVTNFNGAVSSPSNVSVYLNDNVAGGTYNFTVTDSEGCIAEEVIIIEPVGLTISYNEECANGICAYDLIIEGGSGTYTATLNGEAISNDNFLVTENSSNIIFIEDENGCTEELTINTIITSFDEKIEKLFWSQTETHLNIKTSQTVTGYTLYDISGKLINSKNNLQNTELQIPVNQLVTGLYVISLEINGIIFSEKFYKK